MQPISRFGRHHTRTPFNSKLTINRQINLGPTEPPLVVQTSYPRVMFELAFLVSSISKRDLVGRKPRRKIFAEEGLKLSDATGEEVFCKPYHLTDVKDSQLILISFLVPVWASLRDAKEVEDRLAEIKADLLCEMASVRLHSAYLPFCCPNCLSVRSPLSAASSRKRIRSVCQCDSSQCQLC